MEAYSGKQFVGIDLHRRRSVIVRTTPSERTASTRSLSHQGGSRSRSAVGSPIGLRRAGPVRLAGRARAGGEGWAVSRDDQVC